jgi:hypothetical protein
MLQFLHSVKVIEKRTTKPNGAAGSPVQFVALCELCRMIAGHSVGRNGPVRGILREHKEKLVVGGDPSPITPHSSCTCDLS